MLKGKIVAMTFNLGCSSITKCDVKVNPSYNYLATKLFMEDGEEVEIAPRGFVPTFDLKEAAERDTHIICYVQKDRDIKMTGKIDFQQGTIEILGEGFKEVEITAFDKNFHVPQEPKPLEQSIDEMRAMIKADPEAVSEIHSVAAQELMDNM